MDRRTFLEKTGQGGVGLAASGFTLTSLFRDWPSRFAEPAAPPKVPPNIVVILADDMGFSDAGCYGSEIATPAIDRLAEEGIRLTQFYNAARCCPTRASLLTGLYPHQAGVGHMTADLGLPAYRGHLTNRCATIAQLLRKRGYNTAMVGKWHLGQAYDQWPLAKGFDRYTGLLDGASHYFDPPANRTLVRDNKPFAPKSVDFYESRSHLRPDFYMTDFFSDWAVRYTNSFARQQSPFFLYLSYTAPHWPLHAPRQTVDRFQERFMEGWDVLRKRRYRRLVDDDLIEEQWALPPRDEAVPAWHTIEDKERWALKMAAYAAQISHMDRGIGRVLNALDKSEAADDTLVIFLSDNGAAASNLGKNEDARPGSPASYMSYHRPWANLSDTPFQYYKSWTHEGGIATPFIARWPRQIASGGISHVPGHVMDLMPTILEAAGARYPEQVDGRPTTPLEGRSLLDAFRGHTSTSQRTLCWSHMDNHAIRQGRWKLVSAHGTANWRLYDLGTDRTELHDLAPSNPRRVNRMARRHSQWRSRIGVLPWNKYKALRSAQK